MRNPRRGVRETVVVFLLGATVAILGGWWVDRGRAEPARNQPFLWLAPRFELDRDRPPEEIVQLKEHDGLFVILAIPDPYTSEPYDIVAYRRGDQAEQWRLDKLVPTTLAELSFSLPAAWVPPGEYVVDLHGDGIGDAVIASYAFRIERR